MTKSYQTENLVEINTATQLADDPFISEHNDLVLQTHRDRREALRIGQETFIFNLILNPPS